MLARSIKPSLCDALSDTPVVVVVGARQAGKSTLVQSIGEETGPREYVTLDDTATLLAAKRDPEGFIEQFSDAVTIDEVQRAAELLLPIKAAVDRDRTPGKFLLTGSSNVMLVPKVADALVGRVETLTLWPLSQVEVEGRSRENVISRLIGGDKKAKPSKPSRTDIAERMIRGGFPEAVLRQSTQRRKRWLASYMQTVLDREVRSISNIDRLEQLPAMVASVAARVRGPLNKASIAQELDVPQVTAHRYLALLERIYLAKRLRAWHGSQHKRMAKSPKLLISDSGLLCHLLQFDYGRLIEDSSAYGISLESFVGMELVKHAGACEEDVEVMHYRSVRGDAEIDFIVEYGGKGTVGVEVKATKSLQDRDFIHLERLRDTLGDRFKLGVVLYMGERALPFGDRIYAWPVTALWSG